MNKRGQVGTEINENILGITNLIFILKSNFKGY